MSGYGVQPTTDAGRSAVELAETHAAVIADRAAEHDHDRTFPFEAFDAMRASGLLRAAVPARFGGLGVSSLHDLMCVTNRLARGDGSVGIAVNMHLTVTAAVCRLLRGAEERDDADTVAGLEAFLDLLGAGSIAMANSTESGTDVAHPMTEATRVEGGWRLDGRKTFGTLSPVADLAMVTCRRRCDDGSYVNATAVVFRGAPGQTILDNWDALGMRASGSNDVVYEGCVVPDGLYFEQGSWGELDEGRLFVGTGSTVGLLGAFVGIAEASRAYIVDWLRKRTKQPTGRPLAERSGIQHAMGQLELAMTSCHAHLSWYGRHVDQVLIDRPVSAVTRADLHDLMRLAQATKLTLQRAAIDVVDLAMQLSGGAGYVTSSPLNRWYRDVRAGPFMQPLSANEAHQYIGRVALGQDPVVEL